MNNLIGNLIGTMDQLRLRFEQAQIKLEEDRKEDEIRCDKLMKEINEKYQKYKEYQQKEIQDNLNEYTILDDDAFIETVYKIVLDPVERKKYDIKYYFQQICPRVDVSPNSIVPFFHTEKKLVSPLDFARNALEYYNYNSQMPPPGSMESCYTRMKIFELLQENIKREEKEAERVKSEEAERVKSEVEQRVKSEIRKVNTPTCLSSDEFMEWMLNN